VPVDPAWRKVLAFTESWKVPAFPLRGADIVALGELKGPEIGEALSRLERVWIESGFTLDREQLLAKTRPKARN
jgi:hypothetical protein